ncbi:glycosyltransferase [Cyclobacterium roseum]|uniref:glycosyltransferase n=1 Tax=Cyclobacterium roseum TaxID=2666137 RepID=UPI0013916C28|nr:glycosyltransferase [Cyclobacterium roseum]
MKILFLVEQVGPYHHARFLNLAIKCDLEVIEINSKSHEYDWDTQFNSYNYRRKQVNSFKEIIQCISSFRPNAVVLTGWYNSKYLLTAVFCQISKIIVVGISDSTYIDSVRYVFKEFIKIFLLKNFDIFLVAGSRSKNYLKRLGFSKLIIQPWDVVDNHYFSSWPSDKDLNYFKSINRLPLNYWLIVCRFLPKKNHTGLIEAYSQALKIDHGLPDLIFIGSGELEPEIRDLVSLHLLGNKIHFRGFIQIDELPGYYHCSNGLILPSTSDQWGLVVNEALACDKPVMVSKYCGCTDDLVFSFNGLVFDPNDSQDFIGSLIKFKSIRYKLFHSRELLSHFSIDSFSNSLINALNHLLLKE